MPQEKRKRGRRAEKKRKTEAHEAPATTEAGLSSLYIEDHEGISDTDNTTTFYGLLSEEEQEYFKRADEMLALDQFDTNEKALFIGNLYREAAGKELKIAHSQGCSRLLERLILLSTPQQMKALFQCFTGHYLNLVKHRFASHVCETLFLQAAPLVSREMDTQYAETPPTTEDTDIAFASMESLFLFMLHELQPELKQLVTHTFASHTLRTLLLLLSGRPVAPATSLIQSRKKENIPATSADAMAAAGQTSVVPQSFHDAVKMLLDATSTDFSIEELRALAVHPIGSPALQIMLQLEMGLSKRDRRTKEKAGGTLLGKLTGVTQNDEVMLAVLAVEEGEIEGGEVERSFFQNLLYDPVGSHLAESMMRSAPKKDFNILYKRFIRPRIGSLARNETAAFVVQRVLEKLPRDALEDAVIEILPQVPGLIERSRVAILKTLLDACITHSLPSSAASIASAIATSYACAPADLIFRMLHLSPIDLLSPPDPATRHPHAPKPKRDPSQLHGSLLAQSLLSLPPTHPSPLETSILLQPPQTLIALARHPTASHVLQRLLPTRQQLLHALSGNFATLALDPVGSHIVDACWGAPTHFRQRIAEELARAEPELRESFAGRNVWRNWGMDKYKTRRQLWFALGKEEGAGGKRREKTAIELARERHAARGFGVGATESSGAGVKRTAKERDVGGAKKVRV